MKRFILFFTSTFLIFSIFTKSFSTTIFETSKQHQNISIHISLSDDSSLLLFGDISKKSASSNEPEPTPFDACPGRGDLA